MKKLYRVLSLWDVHVPQADAWAFKAVLDFARENKPDHVVLGGDFLELSSCSSHGGDPDPLALMDEMKAGVKALERLRDAAPKAAFTYLEGNHETRLKRIVANNLPTFDGALRIPDLLELDSFGCEWVPYRYLWQPTLPSGAKGKLHYTHGEWATMYHSAKHLNAYGVSVRYGHTHRPQVYTKGYGNGRVCMSIGSGCLRTLNPEWAGPNAGWLHGFGWDEFMPDGDFTAENIVMVKQRFAWKGKVYGKTR
jgi:predicted phosphodiesterase